MKSLLKIYRLPQILHLKADEIPQKQPRIDVKLKRENKIYHIAIEDNGPGIAQQNLERIWEPGFSTFGTSGLGLNGMKYAVDKYRGRIEVESTPFVKTAFNIYIPGNTY